MLLGFFRFFPAPESEAPDGAEALENALSVSHTERSTSSPPYAKVFASGETWKSNSLIGNNALRVVGGAVASSNAEVVGWRRRWPADVQENTPLYPASETTAGKVSTEVFH